MMATKQARRSVRLCAAHSFHLGMRPKLGRAMQRAPGVSVLSSGGRSPTPRGTLDFKWFPGETIRMRVLADPSNSLTGYATDLLKACVDRWCVRDAQAINLTVNVDEVSLPHSEDDDGPIESYDVLIQCLPGQGSTLGDAGRTHLGNYARRQTYGEPTFYLPLAGPSEEGIAVVDQVTVMHELGHVLGLPHAHQNPHLQLDSTWAGIDRRKYTDWIKTAFGVDGMSADDLREFIDGDMMSTYWGNPDQSHWWRFEPGNPVDSIMTYPQLDLLLGADPRIGPLDPSGEVAEPSDEGLEAWALPTGADWELLVDMYGLRP